MKNLYGLFSLGGFMATMLCYVLARIDVTKLELIITFLTWIGIEVIIWGIQKLFHFLFQNEKRARMKRPAHSRS